MRIRRWLIILATYWIQECLAEAVPPDGNIGWSWELLAPSGSNPSAGQYYVRLPQSEQRVLYSAGDTGYHGAVAINTNGDHHRHEANFALGHHALNLLRDQNAPRVDQNQAPTVSPNQNPLDIYLLPQQLVTSNLGPNHIFNINNLQQPGLHLTNDYFHVPPTQYFIQHPQNHQSNYQNSQYTNGYNNQQSNERTNKQNENEASKPLESIEDKSESSNDTIDPILQVFKNQSCSNEQTDINLNKEKYESNDPRSRSSHNINGNYGLRNTERPQTYKSDTYPKKEQLRKNARSERVYPTLESLLYNMTRENEGINKLVASTQDLISNEDLLTINHAAEKQLVQNDDFIKPNQKFELTPAQTSNFLNGQYPRNRITVKAKLENIVDSDIEHVENNQSKEQILQQNSDDYTFESPIVVQDSTMSDFKEQVIKSVMSSVTPYIDAGYQVGKVRNTDLQKFMESQRYSDENYSFIDITPRPIGQRYLAPITVGLRLLNSNDSEIFNTVDDHEYSDSEFISETVKSPVKEKTIVEIQESIPIETIHINNVEVHEYMEDGRPNNLDENRRKNLYNQYMDALESSRKIQENMNENLYKYGAIKSEQNDDSKEDKLETSENIQTEVKINSDSRNQRKDFLSGLKHLFPNKVIQPIVIEKEVPVTKYVDRVVEKPMPYPEPVEVVKEVPVDKFTVLPVPVQNIVEKPFEVTKYVDKPYRVDVPQPYPVEIRVPYPVEQKVYVDRPVHIPYPVEKVIEKQIMQPVPVPTPVAVPYTVEKRIPYPVTVEKRVPVPIEVRTPVETIIEKKIPVPYPVEKQVPYPVPFETKVPVPYPVEKRVPYPVEKIVEKPVTVTQIVEKPVHIQVPVPQPYPVPVKYPQPYPVEKIVEKKVPYPVPVDRVVEKKVPVHVPYPVETVVEKVVEKPVEITKYIDRPYPVEKRVPYPVEKIVEKKIPYPVQVPYPVRVPYPVEKPTNNYAQQNNYAVSAPSQNLAHYQKYTPEQHRLGIPPPHLQNNQQQYQQYMIQKHIQQQHYLKQQEQQNQQNYLKQLEQQKQQQYLKQQEQTQKYLKQQEQTQKYLKQQEQRHNNNLNQIPQYNKNYAKPKVQSVRWGNLYASSYQYINDTESKIPEFKKTPLLTKYLNYVTNRSFPQMNYYGPPPTQSAVSEWSGDENRRTDRTPRMTQLRIEYGFKPPLIPSIEVDLDGMPVEKKENS